MNIQNISTGSPDEFNVLIEIPAGTSDKYEFDEGSGEFRLDFVFRNLQFPFNYGFIPHTLTDDGDPVDVCILSENAITQGSVILARPIGVMKYKDRGEQDDKILAVAVSDTSMEKFQDSKDISPDMIKDFEKFYQGIAEQKKKTMVFEGLLNKQAAMEIVKASAIK